MIKTLWSLFAYIWIYILLVINTENVIDLWEAIATILFFPLLVISFYLVDKNFFFKEKEPIEETNMRKIFDLNFYFIEFNLKLNPKLFTYGIKYILVYCVICRANIEQVQVPTELSRYFIQ